MRKVINGDVDLRKLYLNELFDLSDVEVTGDFDCRGNSLISLKGSPHTVGKIFHCNNNELISLKGAPLTVGGSFYCYFNRLTSLKGGPQTVGGSFYCELNPLISLEGIPKTIKKDFWISKNLAEKFNEDYIHSLSKINGDVRYIY